MDPMVLYGVAGLNVLACLSFLVSELRKPGKAHGDALPASPDTTAAPPDDLAELIDQVERMAADSCRNGRPDSAVSGRA